ncbi:hypothetical protein [Streptomyces sp. NPDC048638]|uniref:hypothetical protein n=1 Tax=Streptomyces sp. NPDC048638 TaxID=3365580 RepID=UPI00371A7A15
MSQAEVDTPLDDAAVEARRAAARAVRTAFRDSGVHAMLEVAATRAAPAVSVTIPLVGTGGSPFPVGTGLPLPDGAGPLQQLLAHHDIHAQVTVVELGPDPALLVALPTGDDALRLAALVIERRSEAHDAALRLRGAFAGIGITEDHIYVTDGTVQVGDISVQDAITLYDVLTGGQRNDAAELDLGDRWDPWPWREVEKLAKLMGPVVSQAAGAPLDCIPHPACRTCISSRPHRITLGSASPQPVLLLADAISSANSSSTSGASPPAN